MLTFTIIMTCFSVCACALGFNWDEMKERKETLKKLRTSISAANQEKEIARGKAAILLQYVDSDREYRTFDDVLRGLPIGSYRGHPRQHRIMEGKQFDLAAFNAISEPCADSMTVTALAFDAIPLHFYGREYTGWERGEWVMVPKKALSR